MLPPAHYAAGLAAGLATHKLTGSPVAGVVVAASTHLLLDYLVDEYWEWEDDDRLDMAKLLSPLGAVAILLTLWLSLKGGSWPVPWTGLGLGWWPLAWGAGVLLADIVDTPLRWLTAKMGWRLKNRSEAGIELFPCHYYSPWYFGQACPRMLSFYGTIVSEYLVSVPALLAVWLMVK